MAGAPSRNRLSSDGSGSAMSLRACAEIVERADPDRFLAAMAAPPEARAILFPIYAFNVEISRAPWLTGEAGIAEMRLQWWRDALEEIAAGKPVRRHEVTDPLCELLDAEGAALLDRLIQARRWDIYSDPFESMEHFDEYLDATAGNPSWVAARALGTAEGESALRDVAWAGGLANWFRAVPELAARGRWPLPDVRPEAVDALAEKGLERLRRGRGRLPERARPALLWTWRARAFLSQARRDPARVCAGGLRQSDFVRRGSLLWRIAFDG